MGGLSSLTVQCSVQVLEINDRNGRQDNYIQMEILFVNIDCIARSLRNNSIMQWLLQWVCDSCCIVERSERVVQGWLVEWCGGGGCPGGWGSWAGNGIQQGSFTLGSVGGIIGHHMRPFMKYLNMSGHCQHCSQLNLHNIWRYCSLNYSIGMPEFHNFLCKYSAFT